jgi:hypothetical protein
MMMIMMMDKGTSMRVNSGLIVTKSNGFMMAYINSLLHNRTTEWRKGDQFRTLIGDQFWTLIGDQFRTLIGDQFWTLIVAQFRTFIVA